MKRLNLNRRTFLHSVGFGLTAVGLGTATPRFLVAAESKRSLKKAVKYGMIQLPHASIEDKLNLVKELGFQGVEMDSPSDVDFVEAAKASNKTGIKIHGIIDSKHWQIRLSDPDPAVRTQGLEILKQALKDAHVVGADTVLLVPGKVTNPDTENYEQCYSRSQAEVRKAIPLAEELKVKIAIEVVWNDFITTPQQFMQYIDDFKNPIVGGYFDCSNMVKYGVPPADWIRALGKRMLKFDFKGYSRTKQWVPIGEGDENWPAILKALDDIEYHGWATAEVNGGGREHLKDVAARINKCLQLER